MNKLSATILVIFISVKSFSQTGWIQQTSGVSNDLYGTFFLNSNTGWCIGDSGCIVMTTNGGNIWHRQSINSSSNLRSLSFPSTLIGYIAGENGLIMKSTNSGTHWNKSNIGSAFLKSICFVNDSIGYTGGRGSDYFFRSFNGGETWDSVYLGYGIECICFINKSTGWNSGQNLSGDAISKTTNSGINWTTQYFTGGNDMINAIFFIDSLNGWCGSPYSTFGVTPTIFKTTNSGNNWYDPFRYTYNVSYGIFFIDLNHGWSAEEKGAIHYTSNSGLNWIAQTPNVVGSNYRSIFFIDSLTGWCVGDSGRILKTTTGGLTYTSNSNTELSEEYSLSQNYPNPFNPKTIINVQCAMYNNVVLKVYDVLGNEVATLINENKPPGNYSVEFDGNNFPSGIYFYRLEVDGNVIDSKRMVLVK